MRAPPTARPSPEPRPAAPAVPPAGPRRTAAALVRGQRDRPRRDLLRQRLRHRGNASGAHAARARDALERCGAVACAPRPLADRRRLRHQLPVDPHHVVEPPRHVQHHPAGRPHLPAVERPAAARHHSDAVHDHAAGRQPGPPQRTGRRADLQRSPAAGGAGLHRALALRLARAPPAGRRGSPRRTSAPSPASSPLARRPSHWPSCLAFASAKVSVAVLVAIEIFYAIPSRATRGDRAGLKADRHAPGASPTAGDA